MRIRIFYKLAGLAATVFAAVVSCSRIEPGKDILSDGSIGFGLDDSKELVMSVGQIKTEGSVFVLNGRYCSGASYNAGSSTIVFDNRPVTYTAGEWTYAPTEFWSKSKTWRFRAYWPQTPLISTVSDDLEHISLACTTPSDPSEQVDILLSGVVERSTGAVLAPQPRVSLEFSHLLSNINVKIKKSDPDPNPDPDEFTITSAQMVGLKDSGTYTDGIWNVSAGAVLNCEYVHQDGGTVLEDDGTPSLAFGPQGLLLIPQSLSGGSVKLVLNYKVTHGTQTKTKSVTIPLPESPAWESGKYYNYILTLSESYEILFGTPQVEAWGSAISSGTVIIK